VDPDLWLTRAALSARWMAIDTRFRQRNEPMLQEWNTFCRKHPELLEVLRDADAKDSAWSRVKRYLKARL
ncbi:MAG: hypothetical protein JWN13_2605, partial [Betaproteobacteria bacterium]|nr:hypothetical protein [Betaproteobacteria bacterium]